MVRLFLHLSNNYLVFYYLAGDMVRHAKEWKPLPARLHCSAGNITGKR